MYRKIVVHYCSKSGNLFRGGGGGETMTAVHSGVVLLPREVLPKETTHALRRTPTPTSASRPRDRYRRCHPPKKGLD